MPQEFQFAEINVDGKTRRYRKPHHKSKSGCSNCKARKVKCDEQHPRCGACAKRGLECSNIPMHAGDENHTAQSGNPSLDCRFSLMSMRLFYHFEHVTSKTLAIIPSIWKHLIPLALKNEYLLHAMLTISAAHIQTTNPSDSDANQPYAEAELRHLSKAISGLRAVLADPITPENSDILFAASALIYQHAWTRTSEEDTSSNGGRAPGVSDFLPLGTRMRAMVATRIFTRSAIWNEAKTYTPSIALQMWTHNSAVAEELERAFERQYRMVCPGNDTGSWGHEVYMTECRRIVPLIGVLKLRDRLGLDSERLAGSIERYIFAWPATLSDGYFELERRGDVLAHVILYHFYTAVQNGRWESMWWARRRTQSALEWMDRAFVERGVKVLNMYASAEVPGDPFVSEGREIP